MRAMILVVAFFLCGCTHALPLSGGVIVASNEVIKADHHVSFVRGATQHNLRTHLQIKHDQVVLIGVGLLGESLFECTSRAQNLSCDKTVPAIPAERLFLDIQNMIWSADQDTRFISKLTYEDGFSGYRLTLRPLNFSRGDDG